MRLEAFQADADLVGRRMRISWELVPEADGELAQAGQLVVRRKTRDFEYPKPAPVRDPFVIYDSNAFPPDASTASVIPGWEMQSGPNRIAALADTAWVQVNGRRVEILRRTTYTTFGADGKPLRRKIELLDSRALEPQTSYYYRLSAANQTLKINTATDAVATATEAFALGRKMYQMLPEVYRRHDVVTHSVAQDLESVPEATQSVQVQGRTLQHGQLRRFLDIFGVALDFMRSRAEGLRGLHDIDQTSSEVLPFLASWVGWDLSYSQNIPVQRHEIRYAAELYQLTGSIPGCMIWVQRLTGWRPRIKEFARNVFFSNSTNSLSVDTANPQTLANLKHFEDQTHFTYDAGVGDDHWYAYNAVGIFVKPDPNETADSVLKKYGRQRSNLNLFLPFNVRGIIILEVDQQNVVLTSAANLGQRSQDQNS